VLYQGKLFSGPVSRPTACGQRNFRSGRSFLKILGDVIELEAKGNSRAVHVYAIAPPGTGV